MKRHIAHLALLLLLAAGIVWWFAGNRSAPAPAHDAAAAAREPSPALGGTLTEADAAEAQRSDTGRRAAPLDERTTAAVPWIEVHIVDAASGAAVPDAEVGCLDAAAWQRLMAVARGERESLLDDDWRCVREFGRSTRSDARGVVRVQVDRSVTIHARHDGRYGRLVVGQYDAPPPGGHRLALHAERGMRVIVLDANGQPVPDVPLVVTMPRPTVRGSRTTTGCGPGPRPGRRTERRGSSTCRNGARPTNTPRRSRRGGCASRCRALTSGRRRGADH